MRTVRCHDMHAGPGGELIPRQQWQSAKKILRSADCYVQKFIKFDGTAICHSLAEYLHLAILESDPNVTAFVPQPFNLFVGRKRYIPDVFVTKGGRKFVYELKPKASFDEKMRLPLVEFFKFHGIEFEVISNESVIENEVLARNWIRIVQTLLSSEDEDTTNDEITISERLCFECTLRIGDIIDLGDRIGSRHSEIALFRLAHSGRVQLNLSKDKMSLSTKVLACT